MIEDDYVSYETALLLKEIGVGFDDIDCDFIYTVKDCWDTTDYCAHHKEGEFINRDCSGFCADEVTIAPSLYCVQKWLKKIKHIDVLEFIHLVPYDEPQRWVYKIDNTLYKEYSEAIEEVIKQVLRKL